MWFKVEDKRTSIGQNFTVRCTSEIGGRSIVEERPVKGAPAARKAAEILATSLNVTATVYGRDANGEFVYGVYEIADGAASASSPLIKAALCGVCRSFPDAQGSVAGGHTGRDNKGLRLHGIGVGLSSSSA